MKKIRVGILLTCCILAVCGCSGKKSSRKEVTNNIQDKVGQDIYPLLPDENTDSDKESSEVLENEGNVQQEAQIRYELASMLPFTEGDDKICAVAYMGNEPENQEQNLTAFYAKYFPSVDSSSWESLPEVNCGGGQCYLIIPRYEDTVINVNVLEKTSEDAFECVKTETIQQEAFLVYCNASDAYANAEIQILYNGSQFVIMPRLSTVSGTVEPMQVALDLTMEAAYQ